MSTASSLSNGTDIKLINGNYNTNNSMVDEIIKVKEQRLKLLQELNKQQEEEFSYLDSKLCKTPKNKSKTFKEKPFKKRKPDINSPQISIRRSARLQNSPTVIYKEDDENIFSIEEEKSVKSPIIRPPNDYGAVPGVEVGFHWETRIECSRYGVHRPTVAGIHGGPNGAYSIALSGGYPEDIDEGYSFIYTGAGGRNLKGTAMKPKNLRIAPQTKDQELERTNLSLVKSIKSELPIRVIRGYKSPSIFAPETGYRYDGLYRVTKYWEDIGKTGHRIYRFRMERIEEQAPPPWEKETGLKAKNFKKQNHTTADTECEFLNDNEEFKENIEPNCESHKSSSDELSTNANVEDIKDVDYEIEKCINLFCKATVIENFNLFKDDCSDSDFLGWDKM